MSLRSLIAARVVRLGWLVVPSIASAQQLTTSLDVGGARTRYADTVDVSALTLTPGIRLDHGRASLGGSGTFSQSRQGSWSMQGMLGGSLFTPTAGPFTGEFSANVGGSAHEDGARTGLTLAALRGHVMSGTRGAWIGGGVGSTWDGYRWGAYRQAEAGVWIQHDQTTALASAMPTVVSDSIRYTDLELAGRWLFDKFELGASIGGRAGGHLPVLDASTSAWGSVSATAWVTPRVGIVAIGGTYPVDYTQGYPGGRFLGLSMRVATSRVLRPTESSGVRLAGVSRAAEPLSDSNLSFESRPDPTDGSRRILRVRAPSAERVEIAGDFSDWQPVSMRRDAAGWWTAALRIPSGTHEMNVRINGGRWVVPEGVLAIRDELGGNVGLLVIR